ncbi:MAG: DUF4270 family protein [Pseudarcicella sp.]|nr:DUF4270 family protein [Pseudarcicella sp.]
MTVFTKSTKNSLTLRLLAIFACFFTYACDDLNEVGTEIVNTNTGVLYTDTMQVEASTVLVDSIVTSFNDFLFAGRMKDEQFGQLEAESFTELSNYETIKYSIPKGLSDSTEFTLIKDELDNVNLQLIYLGIQGNANAKQTVHVYELNNDVKLDSSKVYYSNKNQFPSIKPQEIGSITLDKVNIYKNSEKKQLDTLLIDIKDVNFRQRLNTLITQSKTDSIATGNFSNFVAGLAIKTTSDNNAAIIKFSKKDLLLTARRNLTYSYKTSKGEKITNTKYYNVYLLADLKKRYQNISPQQTCAGNIKITAKREGSLAQLINPKDIINAKNTNNTVFIQEGTGVIAKINFPTLQNLAKDKLIAINKAELIIEPDENPAGINKTSFLTLLKNSKGNVPNRNAAGLDIINITGSNRDSYYFNAVAKNNEYSKQYTFDITNHINDQFTAKTKDEGLFIAPFTKFESNVSFENFKNEYKLENLGARMAIQTKNIKLKLYYSYKQQ